MIGVKVIEKGSRKGRVRELDGNLCVGREKGKRVVLCYIGLVGEENVVKGRRMNVSVVEDRERLDEVVVIG